MTRRIKKQQIEVLRKEIDDIVAMGSDLSKKKKGVHKEMRRQNQRQSHLSQKMLDPLVSRSKPQTDKIELEVKSFFFSSRIYLFSPPIY